MSNTDARARPVAPSPGPLSVLRNLVRALITTPVFLAGHLVRSRDIERLVVRVGALSEPSPLPFVSADIEGLQEATDGEGPLVMRSFTIRIEQPDTTRAELIARLIADPNALNAGAVAGFVVDDRPATDLQVGDRLVVELPGPWNGPVLVERADDTELLLVTLDGHMEAGRIRFDTVASTDRDPDGFEFRITSWARAGDRVFEFLHLRLPIGRELQTAMWVAMCRNAASASNGRVGPIRVRTEILDRSVTP